MKTGGPWIPEENRIFTGLAKIKKIQKSFNSKRGDTAAILTMQPLPRKVNSKMQVRP